MANKKQLEIKEKPEYHNTYLLLRKYRDVVWSLELSVIEQLLPHISDISYRTYYRTKKAHQETSHHAF